MQPRLHLNHVEVRVELAQGTVQFKLFHAEGHACRIILTPVVRLAERSSRHVHRLKVVHVIHHSRSCSMER